MAKETAAERKRREAQALIDQTVNPTAPTETPADAAKISTARARTLNRKAKNDAITSLQELIAKLTEQHDQLKAYLDGLTSPDPEGAQALADLEAQIADRSDVLKRAEAWNPDGRKGDPYQSGDDVIRGVEHVRQVEQEQALQQPAAADQSAQPGQAHGEPTSTPAGARPPSHPDQASTLQQLTPVKATPSASPAPAVTGAPSITTSAPAAPVTPPDPTHVLPKGASHAQVIEWLRVNKPDALAWLHDPEMAKVIYANAAYAAAHGGTYNDAKLLEDLKQTQYWITHGPASRAFDVAIAKGDGTADEQIRVEKQNLQQTLITQGIRLDDAALGDLAKKAIRGAWTPTDVNRWVVDNLRSSGSLPAGQAAQQAATLKQTALNYGIKLTDQAANEWSLGMVDGTKTQDQFDGYLRGEAIKNFGYDAGITKAINDDMTPLAYLGPNIQALASTFELNPEQIDLFNDPRYSAILRFADPESKTQRAMTPNETAQWARDQVKAMAPDQRPTWWKQQDANLGLSLSRFFGLAPQGGFSG